MKKYLLPILLLLLLAGRVAAQKIVGTVTDGSGAPLMYVNIVLMAGNDSSFVAGTVSDTEGHFQMDSRGEGSKVLKLSSVGYKTLFVDVPSDGNVGTVCMDEDNMMLDAVVVKAARPVTRLKGSALVTDVENSLLAKEGTAKDVLGKLPGMTEKENELEVFGKGKPIIYIDGRLVRNSDELLRLGSDEIKDVEVITNPGARYDATVNAVIRIRTIRKKDDGISADVRSQNLVGDYYNGGHQLSLNYRKGGLDLFGSLYVSQGKSPNGIDIDQHIQIDTLWNTRWNRSIVYKTREYYGKIGFMYQLNEHHSLGAYYELGGTKRTDVTDYTSDVLADGVPYDAWKSLSHSTSRSYPSHQSNIYYNGQAGKLEIDFNADYLYVKRRSDQAQNETSENYADRTVSTSSDSRSQLLAEKLVFSYPIGKGTLDWGEEYTHTDYRSRFNNAEGILSGNDNKVTENNVAAFLDYGLKLGKWNLNAGVRYEHVNFRYMVNGTLQEGQSKTYNNVFPSFSVSTLWGETHWSLSFNSKMTRPDYGQLDGNVTYNNRYSYQGGNPFLKPSKRQSLDLSASWKWLYFNLAYEHEKDAIMTINEPYEGNGKIMYITYRNFDKIHRMNALASLSPTFGIWKPVLSLGLTTQWFSDIYNGHEKKFDNPIFLTTFNNSFRLPAGFVFGLDFNYQSRGSYEHAELFSFWRLDASLYRSFLGGSLDVTLKFRDIFDTYHMKGDFYNTNMLVRQINHDESRRVILTLSYKFNSSKVKKYQGSGAGAAEKARL